MHRKMSRVAPWISLVVFFLTAAIFLNQVWKPVQCRPIVFNAATGAVFNSWANEKIHSSRLHASKLSGGFAWDISDSGRTGAFLFSVDKGLTESTGASSGG